jgi:hypothetical protein
MAVFLLKAKHGNTYTHPPALGGSFSDVSGHWAEAWIEQLATEGITSGYPDGTFKPDRTVTRAEMAVFLTKTFNLPIPLLQLHPNCTRTSLCPRDSNIKQVYIEFKVMAAQTNSPGTQPSLPW